MREKQHTTPSYSSVQVLLDFLSTTKDQFRTLSNQLELVKGEWNMLMGELNPISDSILALTALAHLRPSHPIPVDGCVASRR
jgi:hypothetical protein